MHDVFGNTLELGDEVAFTPLKVRAEFCNTWNFGEPGILQTYLNYPQNFAKNVSKHK